MKSVLQKIFINMAAILIGSYVIQGIHWGHDLKTLILAALVLALVNAFLKPFLKIIFLPLNVITLGIFGWFLNAFILYLTTLIVPNFSISSFRLSLGATTLVFNQFMAYIFVAFLLSILSSLTYWLIS